MSLLIMACTEQKNESSLSSDDRNVLPEGVWDAPNQVDISNPHKASKTTTPYHFTYQIGIYANIYPIK